MRLFIDHHDNKVAFQHGPTPYKTESIYTKLGKIDKMYFFLVQTYLIVFIDVLGFDR